MPRATASVLRSTLASQAHKSLPRKSRISTDEIKPESVKTATLAKSTVADKPAVNSRTSPADARKRLESCAVRC